MSDSWGMLLAFYGGVVLYIMITIIAVKYVWVKTAPAHVNSWTRVPVRAAVIAFLASPTFAACGALAPIPFPLIIAMDLYFPGPACGQINSFTPWNFVYVVLPTWVVAMIAQVVRTSWGRRGAH